MSAARHAPATARNRDAILDVLRQVLPAQGHVLEVASGTGEHAIHFAAALPGLVWVPSDPDASARQSIRAWAEQAKLGNLRPPLDLDVTAPWPDVSADAIVCINMVHISPWAATVALMANAGRLLGKGNPLYLYGPYRRAGISTAPSNEAFEGWLKDQNPEFGLRDLEAVEAEAGKHGLALAEVVEMPANNLSVIFEKR